MTVEEVGGIIMLVFVLLLTLAFVVLKLISVITWGWLWVFAPLWITFAIGCIARALRVK